ncbi:MAG: DUF4238 domain-containing protein [Candidatus Limnocylindria bacterium]
MFREIPEIGRAKVQGAAVVNCTRSKRHHFVPQFHLGRFTPGLKSRRLRVWVYDKSTDAIAERPVMDTAVISNYYTIPGPHGPTDELERQLASIEDEAANALRRLSSVPDGRLVLAEDDRVVLSAYLALLHVRVPATRKASEALLAFLHYVSLDVQFAVEEGFPERARERGLAGSDQELEALRVRMLAQLRGGDVTVDVQETASLSTLKMAFEDIAPILYAMPWFILKRRRFPFFVIGDCPVTLWPATDHPPDTGVGFLSPGAEVAVAIDAHTMLVAKHDGAGGVVMDPDLTPQSYDTLMRLDWVYAYNYRTWVAAERFVYARSQADLAAMCTFLSQEERMRRRVSLALDTVGAQWGLYGKRAIDAVLGTQ